MTIIASILHGMTCRSMRSLCQLCWLREPLGEVGRGLAWAIATSAGRCIWTRPSRDIVVANRIWSIWSRWLEEKCIRVRGTFWHWNSCCIIPTSVKSIHIGSGAPRPSVDWSRGKSNHCQRWPKRRQVRVPHWEKVRCPTICQIWFQVLIRAKMICKYMFKRWLFLLKHGRSENTQNWSLDWFWTVLDQLSWSFSWNNKSCWRTRKVQSRLWLKSLAVSGDAST